MQSVGVMFSKPASPCFLEDFFCVRGGPRYPTPPSHCTGHMAEALPVAEYSTVLEAWLVAARCHFIILVLKFVSC